MLSSKDLHESRRWANEQLVSASQRRFLFRDVALELFFSDGRSCLVTMSSVDRNRAYTKLVARITAKAPSAIFQNLDGSEDIKSAGTVARTSQFGSRLANVLSAAYSIPATKSWEKGLISNFHYLMILNSLAGRSYNDLTQVCAPSFALTVVSRCTLGTSRLHQRRTRLNEPHYVPRPVQPYGCTSPRTPTRLRRPVPVL
jgi:PH domain associated with Beige/BEACH/Beige/BEACH domain